MEMSRVLDTSRRVMVERTVNSELQALAEIERKSKKLAEAHHKEEMKMLAETREVKHEVEYLKRQKELYVNQESVLPELVADQLRNESDLEAKKKLDKKKMAAERIKYRQEKGKNMLNKQRQVRLGLHDLAMSRGLDWDYPLLERRSQRLKGRAIQHGKDDYTETGDWHGILTGKMHEDNNENFGQTDMPSVDKLPDKEKEERPINEPREPEMTSKQRFKSRFLDRDKDYLESERVKKMNLPPWLMSKLREHKEAAMVAFEEQKIEDVHEERRRQLQEEIAYKYYLSKHDDPTFAAELTKVMMRTYKNHMAMVESQVRKGYPPEYGRLLLTYKKLKSKSEDAELELKESIKKAQEKRQIAMSAARDLLSARYLNMSGGDGKRRETRASTDTQFISRHMQMAEVDVLNFFDTLDEVEKKYKKEQEVAKKKSAREEAERRFFETVTGKNQTVTSKSQSQVNRKMKLSVDIFNVGGPKQDGARTSIKRNMFMQSQPIATFNQGMSTKKSEVNLPRLVVTREPGRTRRNKTGFV